MGFFSELKEDLSQAVNELIPEEEKAELAAEAAEEAHAAEAEDSEAVPVSAWAESPTQAETEKSGQPEENAEQETVPADTEEKEDIAPEETLPDEAAESAGAVDFPAEDVHTAAFAEETEDSQEKKDMAQLTAWLNELDEKDAPKEEAPAEEIKKENKEGRVKMDNQTREAADETSIITAGMTITGDIASEGSVEVIGTVNGNINILGKLNITGNVTGNSMAAEIFADNAQITGEVVSEGAVKVGQSSVIIGNITAKSAVIAGAVKGDIDVQGPVVLDTSAIVMGNIKSKAVQINNGAVIEGMCSQCYADVNPSSFFEDYKKGKTK